MTDYGLLHVIIETADIQQHFGCDLAEAARIQKEVAAFHDLGRNLLVVNFADRTYTRRASL